MKRAEEIVFLRVRDTSNFWRKAALNNNKEQKPQCERDPEWLAEYQKNKLGTQRKTSLGFWKQVETATAEKEASPHLPGKISNREKMRSKEQNWEVRLAKLNMFTFPFS